jgi:hypothetical protein
MAIFWSLRIINQPKALDKVNAFLWYIPFLLWVILQQNAYDFPESSEI